MNKIAMKNSLAGTLIFALLLIPVVNADLNLQREKQKEIKMDFKIYSSSFKEGELIPGKYGYYDGNISPQLSWATPPEGTKSFALIVDDPDAPIGDWVHWIVFNMTKDANELKENASSEKLLPQGSVEGLNDFKKNNYGGPCPPAGTHRYYFKLYALDSILQLKESATKKILLEAMKGHILAQTALMGKYKSSR
jgi:Raf kinase inhibitor-like YbhB/YbcL family protein